MIILPPPPDRAPVMALPGALLFPHALLPMKIFEARYRQMLAACLEGGRMFCIALAKPGVHRGVEEFHHIAGLGLIRACFTHADGTSHLILQGLARVHLEAFDQEAPYPIAQLDEIPTEAAGDPESEALAVRC